MPLPRTRRIRITIAIAGIVGAMAPFVFMDNATTLGAMSNTLGAFVKAATIMTVVGLVVTIFWQDPPNLSSTDHTGSSDDSARTNSQEEQPADDRPPSR